MVLAVTRQAEALAVAAGRVALCAELDEVAEDLIARLVELALGGDGAKDEEESTGRIHGLDLVADLQQDLRALACRGEHRRSPGLGELHRADGLDREESGGALMLPSVG